MHQIDQLVVRQQRCNGASDHNRYLQRLLLECGGATYPSKKLGAEAIKLGRVAYSCIVRKGFAGC